MVKRIIWSYRAKQDRKEIISYWKKRTSSPNYSIRLNKLITKTVNLIAKYPGIGRRTDTETFRIKLIENYIIIYDVTIDSVIILAIWDTRRNPESLVISS